MPSRFRSKYDNEIKESLKKELGISNPMAVPRIEKIVINMGLGEATQNVKIMDPLVADLASIAGQKPVPFHTQGRVDPRAAAAIHGAWGQFRRHAVV